MLKHFISLQRDCIHSVVFAMHLNEMWNEHWNNNISMGQCKKDVTPVRSVYRLTSYIVTTSNPSGMENQWEHYRLKFDIFCTFLLCLIEGLNHKCIPMKLTINRNVWISIDLTTIINKIVHIFVDLSKLNMEVHCYPLNSTPNIAGH